MSSVDQLLHILFAIYLSECVVYLPDGAMALGARLGRWRAWTAELPVGKSGGALTVLSPLPWQFATFSAPWPVAASSEGLVSVAGLPGSPYLAIAWSDVQKVEAHGRWVHINEARFGECCSDSLADYLAALFRKVRVAVKPRREELIRAALADSLDADLVRARWDRVARGLGRLRTWATLLLLVTFLVVPLAERTWSVWTWVPAVMGMIVLLMLLNLLGMRRVMRAAPELTAVNKIKSTIVTALSPMAAMRSVQTATAHLWPLHHPLAIAAVTTTSERFYDFAGRMWRELQFPILPPELSPQSLAVRITASHESMLVMSMGALLRKQGIDPDSLLEAPPRESAQVAGYCPRCLGQFQEVDSRCQLCGDRAIEPFALPESLAK